MMKAWLEDYNCPPTDGGSFSDFSSRVDTFISGLQQAGKDARILIVTHGGVIREMLRLLLGVPPKGHWYFRIGPASLSTIQLFGDQPCLISFNDTHHLKEDN